MLKIKIDEIIDDYINGGININKLIFEISPLVYSFPKITDNLSEKECEEYFDLIFPELENIIKEYVNLSPRPNFSTWLVVNLRKYLEIYKN